MIRSVRLSHAPGSKQRMGLWLFYRTNRKRRAGCRTHWSVAVRPPEVVETDEGHIVSRPSGRHPVYLYNVYLAAYNAELVPQTGA